MSSRPLRIAFIHPDLGIGGAERLVVDAAVGMQKKGHQVILYTSHHDPNHCFEETRDGTLKVQVRGNWLPRTIFGRFYILCAILRQFILVASLILWKRNVYDVFFIDQLSACVPLLKWFTAAKILFYCHFPDKLLTQRNSTIKKLYRVPVDKMEELTTDMSHMIAVNSGFTAGMFKKSFPSIQQTPRVLYPPINFDAYDRPIDCNDPTVKILETDKRVLLSINRFERKKNVELALRAFAALERNNLVSKEVFSNYRLVLAGGYDKRVSENVEYLEELDQLATQEFGLKTFTIHPSTTSTVSVPPDAQVVFVCSFNDAQRTFLLDQAELLLYTPSNEHFGITPVEGMYASVPVIAVNTGGPVETVKDKETGLLLASDPELWAQGIRDFVTQKYDGKEMGQHGRRHVQSKFSLPAFADQLEAMMMELMSEPSASRANSALYLFGIIGVLFACIFIYIKQ